MSVPACINFPEPNAPFINSLVDGTAVAMINGRQVHIGEQVAYATNYHNVLATASGNNPHIHPSEPNYLWAEAGEFCEVNGKLVEKLTSTFLVLTDFSPPLR